MPLPSGWSSWLPFGPQGLSPQQMLVSTPVCGFQVSLSSGAASSQSGPSMVSVGQGSGGAEAQEQGDTGHEGYGGAEKGRPALAGEGRGGDTVTGAPPPSRPWARGIKAAWRTLPALVQDWEGGGREIKRRGCQNPPLQTLPWGPRSIC